MTGLNGVGRLGLKLDNLKSWIIEGQKIEVQLYSLIPREQKNGMSS